MENAGLFLFCTSTYMFDELNKYKKHGHFFFTPTDSVKEVCNAPDSGHGVCIIYELNDKHSTNIKNAMKTIEAIHLNT